MGGFLRAWGLMKAGFPVMNFYAAQLAPIRRKGFFCTSSVTISGLVVGMA